jgi:ankyrin repeat protein
MIGDQILPPHEVTTNSTRQANLLGRRLRTAIEQKDLAFCESLINQGADLDTPTGTNGNLVTHAIDRGFGAGALLLLDRGASIESISASRRSPLTVAAARGDGALCLALLDRGADVAAPAFSGTTALHEAAKKGSIEVAAILCEHGARIDQTDRRGYTALHIAAQASLPSALEMCEWLLEHGAHPHFVPSKPWDTYLTPHQTALARGFPHVLEFFLKEFPEMLWSKTLANKTMDEIALSKNAAVIRAAMAEWCIETAIGDSASLQPLPKSTTLSPL